MRLPWLTSQGMQMNQQVTFLSDGGETVRELQRYLNPNAEHLLDWSLNLSQFVGGQNGQNTGQTPPF